MKIQRQIRNFREIWKLSRSKSVNSKKSCLIIKSLSITREMLNKFDCARRSTSLPPSLRRINFWRRKESSRRICRRRNSKARSWWMRLTISTRTWLACSRKRSRTKSLREGLLSKPNSRQLQEWRGNSISKRNRKSRSSYSYWGKRMRSMTSRALIFRKWNKRSSGCTKSEKRNTLIFKKIINYEGRNLELCLVNNLLSNL